MTITEAKQYLNYNIKESNYEIDQFDGWSNEQLIAFASKELDMADAYADAMVKGEDV